MRSQKSAVVGVLITLYLSTDAWCFYIPEKKSPPRNVTSTSRKIQICGNELTSFVIELCNGMLSSLDQGDVIRETAPSKITEDCCYQGCTREYFLNFCQNNAGSANKKTHQAAPWSKRTRNRSGAAEKPLEQSARKKGVSEVRAKGRKRKRSFKRKCAYKSFGHYLLKLDRGERVRTNNAKEQNAINRTWPSIEIGTISPEIEKFGGQPIVVVKKKKV